MHTPTTQEITATRIITTNSSIAMSITTITCHTLTLLIMSWISLFTATIPTHIITITPTSIMDKLTAIPITIITLLTPILTIIITAPTSTISFTSQSHIQVIVATITIITMAWILAL